MKWDEIYERSKMVVRRAIEGLSDNRSMKDVDEDEEMNDIVEQLQDSEYLMKVLNNRERYDFRIAYRKLKQHEQRRKYLRVVVLMSSAACIVFACCMLMFDMENYKKTGNTSEQIAPSRKQKAILVKADGEELMLGKRSHQLQEGKSVVVVDSSCIQYSKGDTLDEGIMLYNTLIVPRGGVYQLVLADGTKVWLNSDSHLVYPVTFFGDTRVVKLSGEAYFEVEKDTGKPFIVETGLGKIRVLGTRFNVKFYPEETSIETTLVTGRVSYSNQMIRDIELSPGYQLVYEKGHQEVEVRKVNVQNFISWRDSQMSFQSESLESIMRVLARWYDVDVVFEDEILKELVFSGNLDKYEDIRTFFKLFELGANVEFVVNGKTVYVKAKR